MSEMTETWTPFLEVTALILEDNGNPHRAAKLRRLASLLEQITPEMGHVVDRLGRDNDWREGEEHGIIDTKVSAAQSRELRFLSHVLAALSTAPAEET